MNKFEPAPPVPLPDPLPQIKSLGHKVAYFRRCLTDHNVEVVTRVTDSNKATPLWIGRFNGGTVSFRSIMSSDTGYDAFHFVGDKARTKEKLRDAGVNTPLGLSVDKSHPRESFEAASEFGLPCVVKPKAGSHGRGITLNVNNFKKFERAVGRIKREAIVEKEYSGQDYRIVTLGGKVVAGALRKPANVVGDGEKQ